MASRAADRTVLIADIGGTNARFALLGEEARPRGLATLATRDYGSATEAVRAYLRVHAGGLNPQEAAIAAAGPVIDGRVHMTNAPWSIDAEDLRSGLGIERVALLNDFEALAWSLPALSEEQLVPVGGGAGLSSAPSAVIGPGTGFGVAALVTAGTVETVLVTEGGHATMPCATKREEAIVDMVRADHGHVSIERLLSGDGLVSLYNAIVRLDLLKAPPRSSAEIVSHALAGDCAPSLHTLEAFCALLGGVAGNIALTLGARGGLYIGGGIVPRFCPFLAMSAFRDRFEAKGRMRPYLAAIPTAVIVEKQPTFLGLARWLNASRA